MKAAFWAVEKETDTTANMLILATLLSSVQPCRCVKVREETGQVRETDRTKPGHRKPAGIPQRYWKQEKPGFLFIDCGNRRDWRTKDVLRHADILIINLSPDTDFDSFLLWDIHISKNVFFLISNHIGPAVDTRRKLERVYRMNQQQIGIIPYNNEFQQAFLSGRLGQFVKENSGQARTEQNRAFFYELQIVAKHLLKELEAIQNE